MDKSFRLSRRLASQFGEVVQNVTFRASFLKKKFVLYLTKIMFTSVTSLHEAPRESPGRYGFPTYANNVAFREMSSTAPMKYYCFLSTYI